MPLLVLPPSTSRPPGRFRSLLTLATLFVAALAVRAAYTGPVPAPTDVFGGPGPYGVHTETLPSPGWPEQVVTVYLPDGAPGPRPLWCFAHGFGGIDPVYYDELLRHLASHGSIVVFSPYPANPLQVAENYGILFDGFTAAAARYADRVDLTRVGFGGHSYGGGAVPSLALRAVRERGWGSQGLALLILAPWYSFFVSDGDLASFPAHTQAIAQIYEDDLINDHRIAIDLFHHLAVPADRKEFLLLHSDRIDDHSYPASHNVPTGASVPRPTAAYNALDAWGVHRLAQALTASAFFGDAAGRSVAFGHGSAAQTQMGVTPGGRALRPMTANANPVPLYPISRYRFPFDGLLNPRRLSTPPAAAPRPRLANLSTRARSSDGENVLIVGAAVEGPRPQSLLVRAVGPGLSTQAVANAMPNPQLTLFRGATLDLAIDDWAQTPDPDAFAAATLATGAFPLAADSHDAGLLASFASGTLTALATPANGSPAGVTLVELYAADEDTASTLINLSARAPIGPGDDLLIAGFVIVGDGPLQLLVRGIGPALGNLGIARPLPDPQLAIYRGSERIAANDNWSADTTASAALASTARTVGAFPLAESGRDAALLLTLDPGVYTAHVTPADNQSGIGLIEIYVVP